MTDPRNKLRKRGRFCMALTGMLFLIGAAFAVPTLSAATPFELERARETLKISQAARDRIIGELSDLKASGKASPEVLSAYETYLARVQEMVDENQKALAQMEAAYSAHQARSQAAAAGTPTIAGAAPPTAGPGEDPADRLKALDRQFNESLAAFDEMLLKELRLIQAASAKRMQGLSEAAAEAGRQAGEKGGASSAEKGSTTETAGSGTAGGGSEKGSAGTEQAKTSEGSGQPGGAAGSGQGAGGWGPGGTGAPPGSYTPSPDDDIVARQLREAAEKETDPDLKAKLWKEYEAYKKSQAKP